MKIAIIGDGYIGQAFKDIGTVISFPLSNAYRMDFSKIWLRQFENFDVIINTFERFTGSDFRDIWADNAQLVKDLSFYCWASRKKFIQISTADLYGNHYKWVENVETTTKFDVGTDYRFTKLAAEKFCHPNDLILRIRNPFNNVMHPDNAIIKGYRASKMYAWADTWSYLPDVVNATLKLLELNETGIWNVVNLEPSSLFYVLKSAIGIPFFKSIDPIKEDMPNFLMREFDNERIHNDVNAEKLKNIFQMTPLDAAMIISWEGIKDDFNVYFDEQKFLTKLETDVNSTHDHEHSTDNHSETT